MKFTKYIIFSGFIIVLMISSFIFGCFNNTGQEKNADDEIDEDSIKLSIPFELVTEFEPSTYYISPESSPGENDVVYFTFEASRNGNYSLDIENYPSLLTQTSHWEYQTDFNNPNGTDDYVISCRTIDLDVLINQDLRVLISEDQGGNWREQVVHSYDAQAPDYLELLAYLSGTSVAATPDLGIIGIMTWVNRTDLEFFRSYDKGFTWSDSFHICNVTDLGLTQDDLDVDSFPELKLGILKNGTMYAILADEEFDSSLTDVVYFQSKNDGSKWTGPFNVSSLEGKVVSNPKFQVDYNSGSFWLMVEEEMGGNDYLTWAEFGPHKRLNSSNIAPPTFFDNQITDDWDFFLGKNNYKFNVVHNKEKVQDEYSALQHLYKNSFMGMATNRSLGFSSALEDIRGGQEAGFSGALVKKKIELYFPHDYTGNYEIYKYVQYNNNTFWQKKGLFTQFSMEQMKWDGRIRGNIPINTSMVRADFTAQNGSNTIDRQLLITIDNQEPHYLEYEQGSEFFNPISSNITISKIPWDLLPSEQCDVILEIYKEDKSIIDWKPITENNWEESNPYIFTSDTGIIYILYQTLESGRKILYLTKSLDRGASWETPLKIYETTDDLDHYLGAAWGDVVIIYEKDDNSAEDYLYRSFDQGKTFQTPRVIDDTVGFFTDDYDKIDEIVFGANGTMHLTFLEDDLDDCRYSVYTSWDLGLTWMWSNEWIINHTNLGNVGADIIYDPENDVLHIAMMAINESTSTANITLSTFNVSNWWWSGIQSTGPFALDFANDNPDLSYPQFTLYRHTPTAPISAKLVFISDFESGFIPIYTQITTEDLGKTWSGLKSHVNINYSVIGTFIDDLFYARKYNDGNDFEIFFTRNSSIVQIQRETVSASSTSEVTFDGIDDFGNYIPGGNYTYKLFLQDNAGNRNQTSGWIFADYNAPIFSDISLNYTVPTPGYDINISLDITDETLFSAHLFYQREGQSWIKTSMNKASKDNYYAIIPGQTSIKQVRYYIKAIDSAGNINTTQEYSYGDYKDPVITDVMLNWTIPTPSVFVNVSANITDDSTFVAKLFYRYDGGDLENITMSLASKDIYYGIIPGKPSVKLITYKIWVNDSAGNIEEYEASYSDDDEPVITDINLNWTNPTPSNFVNVSVNITDDSAFAAKLFYKLDGGAYVNISMSLASKDIYYAIIPSELGVKLITYKIWSNDSSGNEDETSEYTYGDSNAPSIIDRVINWTQAPTPFQSVKITVNITDETAFYAYMLYKRDSGAWNNVSMTFEGGDLYSAVIRGDEITEKIEYYFQARDLAGNSKELLDAGGLYFSYNIPDIDWDGVDLFEDDDDDEGFSSGKNYDIEIEITEDNEYVDEVVFKYRYNNEDDWHELELKANSPTYTGKLKDLPADLRKLTYKIVITDIFGDETESSEKEVEFYPEVPSFEVEEPAVVPIMIIAAVVGFAIAFSYIKLKSVSHERISREILSQELKRKLEEDREADEEVQAEGGPPIKKKTVEGDMEGDILEDPKGDRPFLIAYLSILIVNLLIFFAGLLSSVVVTELGIMLIGASLLVSVLGYMFLMSRDIQSNIYSEKIMFKNIALELFQIVFMLVNVLIILIVGYQIAWFRYYLLEDTVHIGELPVPRLYLSVIAVFFTSLVLVAITTLIKLNKTVKNIRTQREKGATGNLLLYVKEQEASRLITRLGFKTIAFLITVLASIVMTTDALITDESTRLVMLIMLPFIVSSFLALYIDRKIEARKIDKKIEEIKMPFIDSKKFCSICGEPMYLLNRFCGACGDQQVYESILGTYTGRCKECNALVYDEAKYCTNCSSSLIHQIKK